MTPEQKAFLDNLDGETHWEIAASLLAAEFNLCNRGEAIVIVEEWLDV